MAGLSFVNLCLDECHWHFWLYVNMRSGNGLVPSGVAISLGDNDLKFSRDDQFCYHLSSFILSAYWHYFVPWAKTWMHSSRSLGDSTWEPICLTDGVIYQSRCGAVHCKAIHIPSWKKTPQLHARVVIFWSGYWLICLWLVYGKWWKILHVRDYILNCDGIFACFICILWHQ